MKKIAALLTATLIHLPPGAIAQVDNYEPYHALLAKHCASKNLEFVSPGDLDTLIAGFHDSLPAAQKRRLDRANDAKIACAQVIAGLTCGNVADLRAMTKVGLLPEFARKVCASGLVCREQSDCTHP